MLTAKSPTRNAAERAGSPHPGAETDEDRNEDRRERGSQPEQGVEHEHGLVHSARMEISREGVERRDDQAETNAEERGCNEEKAIGQPLRRGAKLAGDEQGHGDEICHEPGEVDPFKAEALGDGPSEQRR
jgi:hypothetical protein